MLISVLRIFVENDQYTTQLTDRYWEKFHRREICLVCYGQNLSDFQQTNIVVFIKEQ